MVFRPPILFTPQIVPTAAHTAASCYPTLNALCSLTVAKPKAKFAQKDQRKTLALAA